MGIKFCLLKQAGLLIFSGQDDAVHRFGLGNVSDVDVPFILLLQIGQDVDTLEAKDDSRNPRRLGRAEY